MLKRLKQKFATFRKSRSNLNMIVTAIAVVMIWRGVRGLLDKFLFPHHPMISYIVGLLIGILILFIDDSKLDELSTK